MSRNRNLMSRNRNLMCRNLTCLIPCVLVLPLVGLMVVALDTAHAATLPVAGARAWYETENGEGTAYNSSGGFVDSWLDQSGNGFHVSNTAGNRPAFVSSIPELNNQSALGFDGDDDRLFGNHAVFTTGVATIFAVSQVPATPDGIAAYFDTGPDGGSQRWFMIAFDDPLQLRFGRDDGTTIDNPNLPPLGELTTITVVADGANSSLSIDGATQVTGNVSNDVNSNVAPFVLGSRFSMLPNHQHFDGNYAELIIYDSVLSAPDRLAVESYLESKYVPEPSTLGLLGVVGLLFGARRRR